MLFLIFSLCLFSCFVFLSIVCILRFCIVLFIVSPSVYKRVNQKVKAVFKLRGNRDREELADCAVLTMPVEEFSHV